MQFNIKKGLLGTAVLFGIGASIALGATAANAATTGPSLDSILDTGISHAVNCVPGVTMHTDYKWVPDVSAAGPTMWTTENRVAPASATFTWKGAAVAYHRDGTKTQQFADTQCGDIRIANQTDADQLMAQYSTTRNVDVSQGADVQLRWVDLKGALSVEGHLSLASSQIEGNAVVSGPGAGLGLFNDPGNHFWGNLTVNAAGGYWNGSGFTALHDYSNGQQVDGNLTFTNNAGAMGVSGSMNVNGDFTYSGNALPYPGGLSVLGTSTIS
jgi:hypothetical protein